LDDYIRFSLHVYWKSPSARTRFRTGWLLPPVVFLGVAAILQASYSLTVLSACVAVGGVAHLLFHPLLFWHRVEAATRRTAEELGSRGIVGRITLILTEESLTEVTEAARSEAKWGTMAGVEEVGDCTYIYVTPLLGAVIPRSGFDREEDYLAVRDFAFRKLGHPG
jgi:hypothetical protein